MPKGVYKHHPQQGFKKGNHPKNGFKKGHKPIVGFKKGNKWEFKKGMKKVLGSYAFPKGYKWTKEHRENHRKYKRTEHHKSLCGQYKRTEYHRNISRELFSGEKNPSWRGGISLNKRLYQQSIPRYIKNAYSRKHRHKIGISGRGVRLGGELTIQTIQRVYENNIKVFGTLTCYICLEPTVFGKDVLEHIIPLSRKGTNEYENLAIACCSCNGIKRNRLIQEIS